MTILAPPVKQYKVMAPNINTVWLVGCGGTGSFVALALARLAHHLREGYGRQLKVVLFDPDTVEEKNIGRQNFCKAEVGQPKAWTLMRRLNAAFGLDVSAKVQRLAKGSDGCLSPDLVIGAVDTATARREIIETVKGSRAWWLDCGNHEHAGQVLFGNQFYLEKPLVRMGYCVGLPAPSVQHPELVSVGAPAAAIGVESCAELAVRDAQSLMVNQMVASWAASYVYRLCISKDLDVYATYFDLVTGSSRSEGIVGDA